jgi:MoxR-like ATPase
MPWDLFTGTGRAVNADAWRTIPAPPPWRERGSAIGRFVASPELLDAVNAALHLRRPLLLTGPPGSGKSTLVTLIANELQLGTSLSWHITSRSTLNDALFQYDALARLQATQVDPGEREEAVGVEQFVTLGPLGTALAAADRPRAVLIDEIDKSDLDLPGDLLNVLELGEFDVPPLVRASSVDTGGGSQDIVHHVRGADRQTYTITNGIVRRAHLPVIVLTSNGERSFAPAFLRRCIRFDLPMPDEEFVESVVAAHLGQAAMREHERISEFTERLRRGEELALDQLLSYIYLVTGDSPPDAETREHVAHIVLSELSS